MWQHENYFISTDKTLLNIPDILRFLIEESYWGKDRTETVMRRAIEHSAFCFGLYQNINGTFVLPMHTTQAMTMCEAEMQAFRSRPNN